MPNSFKHPLARDAHIWSTAGLNGPSTRVLVVITTLHLDKADKSYKADKIEKLSEAARTWVKEHALEASDFMLINRPKDWN